MNVLVLSSTVELVLNSRFFKIKQGIFYIIIIKNVGRMLFFGMVMPIIIF